MLARAGEERGPLVWSGQIWPAGNKRQQVQRCSTVAHWLWHAAFGSRARLMNYLRALYQCRELAPAVLRLASHDTLCSVQKATRPGGCGLVLWGRGWFGGSSCEGVLQTRMCTRL